MIEKHWSEKISIPVFYTAITLFLGAMVILNLTPPISRDALIHHLAIPKLWLTHGGFFETPWADFSYYPMNIDLLYLVALYFKNDIAPKFIHLAFGLGTGLLIYFYLKKRLGKSWGLLGLLIFISAPIIVRLSTSAYIDLGMVFFTTASLLSYVRWRDDGYKSGKWLILAAVCMGLAAGSKYNAFLAWFFLNLMIVYYYSRDTGKGIEAVKAGTIFFGITALIVSPWLIKNCILTGNPIYPLFDSLFNPPQAGGASGSARSSWTANIFLRRELVYAEGFYKTIFIPVRIFFDGKDNSAQYFDGVLNPIFIVMLPFAFLGKDHRQRCDRMLFFLFSLFFVLMACFLTVVRVRYILPVMAPLTILAVFGIRNIFGWAGGKTGAVHICCLTGVIAATVAFISFNIVYTAGRFNSIRPFGCILKQETKDQFLTRHLPSYPAIKYINENLPADSKIFLIFLGRQGYYLNRPYCHEPSFGMRTIRKMVEASEDRDGFQACLQTMDISHILMRTDLFYRYLHDNFPEEKVGQFLSLANEYLRPVYQSNGYAVMELLHSTDEGIGLIQ